MTKSNQKKVSDWDMEVERSIHCTPSNLADIELPQIKKVVLFTANKTQKMVLFSLSAKANNCYRLLTCTHANIQIDRQKHTCMYERRV